MSLALDDEVLNPAASNSTKMELMLRARTARERSVTAPTSLAGNASKIAPGVERGASNTACSSGANLPRRRILDSPCKPD
jgi:hypothetical protein